MGILPIRLLASFQFIILFIDSDLVILERMGGKVPVTRG